MKPSERPSRTAALVVGVTCCFFLPLLGALQGCKGGLLPERTAVRTVVHFLKAVGRSDFEGAREWVAPDAHDDIGFWALLLFFPEHSIPPTVEEEEKIDQFIGLFYRITVMEESETEAKVHMVFVATDAIIGFPSVAEDPLVPNSAAFRVMLRREPASGESPEEGKWRITSLEPITESR